MASSLNQVFLDKMNSNSPSVAVEALKTYLVDRLGRLLYEKKQSHRDVRVEDVDIRRIVDKTTIYFSLVEGVRRVNHEKEWTDVYLMAETRPFPALIERELHEAMKAIPPGQREGAEEEKRIETALSSPRVKAVKVIVTFEESGVTEDHVVFDRTANGEQELSTLFQRGFDRRERADGWVDFVPTGTESMTITLRKKS